LKTTVMMVVNHYGVCEPRLPKPSTLPRPCDNRRALEVAAQLAACCLSCQGCQNRSSAEHNRYESRRLKQ
jgi:pyruvate-formate lyase-activating enzyme